MAALPCDIEPVSKEDRVYMVLWFRQSGSTPIYSFDVRGRSLKRALHWSDPNVFGSRAYFITGARPGALSLQQVQLDDEGVYRCRVDFKNSPTRNYLTRFTAVVPPHQVQLYDEAGRHVTGVVGPLQEGDNFTLYCEVRGGHPQPKLMWKINRTPIDDYAVVKNDGKVIFAKITLTNAQRSWLNNTVRCQANNTILLNPRERSARIEMNLRPTLVEIITKPGKLVAGNEVTLECVVKGSRPLAQITWYKDNRQIFLVKQEEWTNETVTVSRMRLRPRPADDGATVCCRAENTQLGATLEHAITLAVAYKPVTQLTISNLLKPEVIKEGNDVFFECLTKSKYSDRLSFTWEHNGKALQQLSDKFKSTKALVLQNIRRKDAGTYVCLATNEYGTTRSQVVYLRVQHRPVCTESAPVVIGARLDEQVRVRCSVSADPTQLQFVWHFNSSGQLFQVSAARYVKRSDTSSELLYSAASERDYGLLLCRASNAVGTQDAPCVFRIVPAELPHPPWNCSATKQADGGGTVLAVRFLAGFDGGFAQHFLIYAFRGSSKRIVYKDSTSYKNGDEAWINVSWSFVETVMENEVLAVVARNAKGASDPCLLQGLVIRDPPMLLDDGTEEEVFWTERNVAAIFILVSLLVLIAIGTTCTVRDWIKLSKQMTRRRRKQAVVQVSANNRRVDAYPSTKVTDDAPLDVFNAKSGARSHTAAGQ